MSESTPINWTERDYACAQWVLESGPEDRASVLTLADEAIVALDGIGREQMTALPWLEEHAEDKELLCNVALRGLLASGAAFPIVLGEGQEPSGLAADDTITGVMALRRTGERIITVELQKDGGPVWLYGYVHADKVLEEVVDSAGSHAFMVTNRSDFPSHVMELSNAAGILSADGSSTSYSVEEFQKTAGVSLDGTLGVASMTGVSLDESTFANYTLYSLPDQLLALTSSAEGADVVLTLTPVAADSALAAVTELVEKGLASEPTDS